ncbi:hypothetical protein QYM36_014129 [Artemia franciscana]|uniref:Uncharacterized protein n=1 Tax=Artemia franciscana TaxID=6661 RepID=A0AA88HP73_ARTSF|nr:hypothetical protein QYM36_014129 [Artemia franciscana]
MADLQYTITLDQAIGFLDDSNLSDLDLIENEDGGNESRPFNDDGHLRTYDNQSSSKEEEESNSLDNSDLSNFDSVLDDEENDIPLSGFSTNARLDPKSRSGKANCPLYK